MPWRRWRPPTAPDLEDQFEDLLNTVWDSERRERMNDRIDQAGRLDEFLEERRRLKGDRDQA